MLRRIVSPCLIAIALVTSVPARAAERYPTPAVDPYTLGYLRGYRYVPYPLNEPYAQYKVPVYMYGYFGARPRHEPVRNQGFNDFIRDCRRGYVW